MDGVYRAESAITSYCRDCVLAVRDGSTQTGCAAGRLDLFRRRDGVRVELVVDPPGVESPQEFYAIDGGFCFFKRRPPWEGTADDVRREMKQRMNLRLFIVADRPDPASLAPPVRSAAGFTTVSVLKGDEAPKRSGVVSFLRESSPVPWTVDWPLDAGESDWPLLLDQALHGCRSTMYVVARAATTLPEDLADRVRSAVVDRDRVFLALEGDGWFLVQTRAHREAGGNAVQEGVDGVTYRDVLSKLRMIETDRGERFVLRADEVL